MSKMAELDLDRQQIEQVRGETRVNENVRQRLHYTALGAEMVSRNVRALPFRPPFPTSAQDELADAERVLEDALQLIRNAMVEYQAKEIAV